MSRPCYNSSIRCIQVGEETLQADKFTQKRSPDQVSISYEKLYGFWILDETYKNRDKNGSEIFGEIRRRKKLEGYWEYIINENNHARITIDGTECPDLPDECADIFVFEADEIRKDLQYNKASIFSIERASIPDNVYISADYEIIRYRRGAIE